MGSPYATGRGTTPAFLLVLYNDPAGAGRPKQGDRTNLSCLARGKSRERDETRLGKKEPAPAT